MKNIVIAGGGTGGHIYPGIAIARALQSQEKDVNIHFIGAHGGLEEQIVPREGFSLHLLRVGKLNYDGGFLGKLQTLLGLPLALLRSVYLVLKLRPVAVLGVGGYASGPFVLMASLMRRKTFLWEPNAFPGMTNRILAFFVYRCFVVFDKAKFRLKNRFVEKVGLPVRRDIEKISIVEKNDDSLNILVFGGSQGAVALNQAVVEACEGLAKENLCVKVLHQTGRRNFDAIKKVYENRFSFVDVRGYLHDMASHLNWADLVICRGGASTIAELMAAGRPALIVPLPTAADDHQRKNAQELVARQAAEIILQKDLNGQILVEKIKEFVRAPDRLQRMGKEARSLHVVKAAETIAQKLLQG